MPKIFYPPYELERDINIKIEDLLDKQFVKKDPNRIKKMNQKAARKRAKFLGIQSLVGVEIPIRNALNERIIQEVKLRKLRHIDVSDISLVPRTKITAIMNRNLKEVTIDLLIRILSSLGVSASIHID